jgi:hypothetical protein
VFAASDSDFTDAIAWCPNNACIRYCTIPGTNPTNGVQTIRKVMRWKIGMKQPIGE